VTLAVVPAVLDDAFLANTSNNARIGEVAERPATFWD
jgi:hypothetical protein